MNSYSLFRYITGNSKIHLMNSKMKILWILFSSILVFLIKDYVSLFIFLSLMVFIVMKTEISLKNYLSNLLVLWPLYVIFFAISFVLTFDINFSILLFSKIIFFALLFIILTFTTSLSEIAWGFENLFIKLKKVNVPVTKISLRIAFGIKFISTLFEQSKEIRKSMAYRGIPYKSGVFTSFKKMFLPVVRLSYKLSRRTIKAMKLRFYGYSKTRTNYHENKATSFDRILIVINIIILYVIVYCGWL